MFRPITAELPPAVYYRYFTPTIFQLNKLDLVYELQEQRNTGVRVVFYIFQYGTVLSPSVVTKVMEQVPREKVS